MSSGHPERIARTDLDRLRQDEKTVEALLESLGREDEVQRRPRNSEQARQTAQQMARMSVLLTELREQIQAIEYPAEEHATLAAPAQPTKVAKPVPLEIQTERSGPLAWQADAICRTVDPEIFFPEKGGSVRDAKKVCDTCKVKAECLDYALENNERFGVWGGESEQERRMRRRRGRAAQKGLN